MGVEALSTGPGKRAIIAPDGQSVLQITLPVDRTRTLICSVILREKDEDMGPQLEQLIPGFRMLEQRPVARDETLNYKCAQYVFRNRMKERWSQRRYEKLFDTNGYSWLLENYDYVTEPQPNDIAAYCQFAGSTNGEHPCRYKHFGIFDGEMIESKWGAGDIYRHPYWAVATPYGKALIFLRKKVIATLS